jgi:hypothetical protein
MKSTLTSRNRGTFAFQGDLWQRANARHSAETQHRRRALIVIIVKDTDDWRFSIN